MPYTQPVKVNDVIEIEIESLGEKGDGIARYENFVIIVPEGILEEEYKVKVVKVFKNFAVSEIIERI